MNSVLLGFLATLLGSLFGGFFALYGTYLSNRLTLRRDRELWERQQQAEREKFMREEDEHARERLREIYENSIRSLTQYINVHYGYDPADSGQPITAEDLKKRQEEDVRYETERAKYLVDARHWLLLLLVNLQDIDDEPEELKYSIEDFFEGRDVPGDLLGFVMNRARNDPRLKIKFGSVAALPPDHSAKPKELHGV